MVSRPKEVVAPLAKGKVKVEEICVICLDEKATKTAEPCLHKAFCEKCIADWRVKNAICPMCRVVMTNVV